ncbi:hypothetical protein BH20ACI1_BH20ACI1_01500 [soil metagenome]
MKRKAIIGGVIALIILAAAIIFCIWAGKKINEKLSEANPDTQETTVPNLPRLPDSAQSNLPFGNPSGATANPLNANNYLMENRFYTLSYNREKSLTNWVAWWLTRYDLGETLRQDDFRPDNRLPADWTHITPSDYSRSGFDRGHLAPSADRSNSLDANSSTFLMTNISPQTPDLNQGPWKKLENYSRSLARRGGTLYIIAGQYGNLRGKIKNKITVPTNFWKIIVVMPPNSDFSSINSDTRIIAVDMPNVSGIKNKNWREYRTTVRDLEQKNGYNFFSNLPQNLQNALETKTDTK